MWLFLWSTLKLGMREGSAAEFDTRSRRLLALSIYRVGDRTFRDVFEARARLPRRH